MYKIRFIETKYANKVRNFCLSQIKNEYGYDYTPEWHSDLDSILDGKGMYYPSCKGSFYFAEEDNVVIATSGFRDLRYKPTNHKLFVDEFKNSNVGSIWRTYTDRSHRFQGIATNLLSNIDKDAKKYKYQYIYLHTSWNKPDSVKFWMNRGFKIFLEEKNADLTVHMAKVV